MKRSKFRLKFLATLALLASVVTPTYAGGWVFDHFNLNGSTDVTSSGGVVYPTDPWTLASNGEMSGGYPLSIFSVAVDHCSQETATGTVQAVFKYMPDVSGSAIPINSFLIFSLAGASNTYSMARSPLDDTLEGLQESVNDGFSDGPDMSDTADNSPEWDYYDAESKGWHLETATLSTDSSGVTWATLPAYSISAVGGYNKNGLPVDGVDLIMIFTPDTRTLVTSSTVDQSYHIDSAAVPGGTGWQDKNSVGQGSVDSAVIWNSNIGHWVANPSFSASTTNFTDPTYTFSWSGAGTLTSSTGSGQFGLPNFTQSIIADFGSSTSVFPAASAATMSAQDSTGSATPQGTYNITWHLPYEPTEKYADDKLDKTIINTRIGSIAPGETGLRIAEPAQKFEMSAVFSGLGLITAAVGQEELAGPLEIIAKVADITQWEYDYPGESADQIGFGATNDPDNWTVAQTDQNEIYTCTTPNIPADLVNNADGWQYCYLSIDLIEKTTTQYWWANVFNIHGFTGVSNATITPTTVDLVQDEPFFKRFENPNGTPYTG